MNKLLTTAAIVLFLASCSTCYECSEEVILYSGNTPTDTTISTEELCTADASVIDDREAAGATCVSL